MHPILAACAARTVISMFGLARVAVVENDDIHGIMVTLGSVMSPRSSYAGVDGSANEWATVRQ